MNATGRSRQHIRFAFWRSTILIGMVFCNDTTQSCFGSEIKISVDKTYFSQIIEHRQQIRSGQMQVSVTHDIATMYLQSYAGVKRSIESAFYVDRDWWRQDVNWAHPRWKRRSVSLVNNDGSFHDAGGGSLYGLSSKNTDQGWHRPDVYDFRFVGLVGPLGSLATASRGFHAFGWFNDIASLDAVNEVNETHLAKYTVNFGGKSNVRMEVTMDPNLGNAPVRIFRSMGADAIDLRVSYFTEPLPYGTGDDASRIWFPKNVTYEMIIDGVVGYKETIEIISVDFTALPPSHAFTVKSFGLPKGRRIMGDGSQQMLISNNGLRDATIYDHLNPDQKSFTTSEQVDLNATEAFGRMRLRTILLYVNAVALLCAVSVLVWYKVRRRKIRRDSSGDGPLNM